MNTACDIALSYQAAIARWPAPEPVMCDGERAYCSSVAALWDAMSHPNSLVMASQRFEERTITLLMSNNLFAVRVHAEHGVWLYDGRMIDALVLYSDYRRAEVEYENLIAHYEAHLILVQRGLLDG